MGSSLPANIEEPRGVGELAVLLQIVQDFLSCHIMSCRWQGMCYVINGV